MNSKILIIKISAIGDVIMALPMLQAIRDTCDDCEITWVCGDSVEQILKQFDIDNIVVVNEKLLLRGNFIQKIIQVLKIWKQIVANRYNLVVIGHGNWKYRLLALPLFYKKLRFFGNYGGRKWPVPGRHFSDEYVRLILGEEMKIVSPYLMPNLKISGNRLFSKQRDINKKVIAISPGGAKNILRDDGCRRWPVIEYVKLTKLLINNGFHVVLTGAPSDEWVVPYFKGIDRDLDNYVGKTSILELINLYSQVDLAVMHDSGPLHLAGLAGTTIIALFGPTNPYEKIPNVKDLQLIWGGKGLCCRPCYDGVTYAKCDSNECLKQITADLMFSIK